MHLAAPTYNQTALNATLSGTFAYFTFTAKERDEETGYGYFGARYMDHELMTMWLSVDPMADKYPGISPYAYCAWNPVKLVDPDGREVLLIGSTECISKAINAMNNYAKHLSFSVDGNGKVSYTGKPKGALEKYMAKMIDDNSVSVNLTIQESNKDSNGDEIYGGCFDGNQFSNEEKTRVNAFQTLDLITAAINDNDGESGRTIWHEISEAYEGGKISINTKTEAQPSYYGVKNTIQKQAHHAASQYFPATKYPIVATDPITGKNLYHLGKPIIERYIYVE